MKRMLKSVIVSAIVGTTLVAGSANAALFSPFTVTAPDGHTFTADKITGNYNESITVKSDGTFNLSLYWSAGQFVGDHGESAYNAKQTGLGYDYGLYLLYTAAGTVSLANGMTTFNVNPSANALSMYLDSKLDTKVMPVASGFNKTNTGDDLLLATGDALSGSSMLNPALPTCRTGGINCGSFGSSTSFALTADGSNFFVLPATFYDLSFQSGQLNSLIPVGTRTINGSLDIVFAGPAHAVPEPASLGLLALGLAGIGVARRRKPG